MLLAGAALKYVDDEPSLCSAVALAVPDWGSPHADRLWHALASITWASPKGRKRGVCCSSRALLLCGYGDLAHITEADLQSLPLNTTGIDLLDAGLCAADPGPFGAARRRSSSYCATVHHRRVGAVGPRTIPPAAIAYLNAYQDRATSKYATIQTKMRSMAYFFHYLVEVHPELTSTAEVLPHHARSFIDWTLIKVRTLQRDTARKSSQDWTASYDWFVDVRAIFADLRHWAANPAHRWRPTCHPRSR